MAVTADTVAVTADRLGLQGGVIIPCAIRNANAEATPVSPLQLPGLSVAEPVMRQAVDYGLQ